ncbi:MAG TPA: hypothetical protein VMT16_00185 [Thermoanaerobaculia bacterium]|nr:hypothetical protein [Thermoanaerobaculia bacterium]
MGERAAETPLPRRSPPPAGFWVLLALLSGLVLLAGWPRPELDATEVTQALLAASLAVDGDRVFAPADAARLERWQLSLGSEHPLPRPRLIQRGGDRLLAGDPVHAALVAPAVALGGVRLGLIAQGLLMAAATLFSGWSLRRGLGIGAWSLTALLLAGSVTAAYGVNLWPQGLHFALVLTACAAIFAGSPLPRGSLEEVYSGPQRTALPLLLGRWSVAGILLGLVGAAQPWALPLVVAPVAAVPRGRRRAAVPALLLGAVAAVAGVWALTGFPVALQAVPDEGLSVFTRAGEAVVASPATDPRLWGWNVLYLAAGRHLGIAWYLAPALLLPLAAGRRGGRWVLWLGCAAALALLLGSRPFGLADASTVAAGPLLPLYAALWMTAVRPLPRLGLALGAVWAAACLWPLWMAPRGAVADEEGRATWPPPYLARIAPVETTQAVGLPLGPETTVEGARVWLVGGAWLGRGGAIHWMGHQEGELLIAAPWPLGSFRLEAGQDAGAELAIAGGETTETLIRADGSVGFGVRPAATRAVHPVPWQSAPAWFYRLRLRLSGGPPAPVRVRVHDLQPQPYPEEP